MRLLAAAGFAALLSGCRAGDPLQFWQQSVEAYVEARGQGDLGVLQSAGQTGVADDPRPALAIVSARQVWTSTPHGLETRDAHGVLVGLAPSRGKLWYVFALGICDTAENAGGARTVDLRVAAVSGGPRQFQWRISEANAAQLERYQAKTPPPWPALEVRTAFPRAADDFVLTQTGRGAEVLERHSGAAWGLLLDDEPEQLAR